MSPRKKIILAFFTFLLLITPLACYRGLRSGGRVNFLLLGTPGGDHPGANLADTVILLSIDPRRQDLVAVSIPRDVWIPSTETKFNALYPLGGLELIEAEVGRILGLQEIDFGVVVDFEGFKKVINLVGGIEVEVKHSFDDFFYPLPGKENDDCGGDPEYHCRYEHLHFDQGPAQMDGTLALKFARSRYATDSAEGTDFARSQRQQKIITAFKNKFFAEKLFSRPVVLWGFWEIFQEHVATDLNFRDCFSLLKILFRSRWNEPRIFILDWGEKNEGGLLINPPVEEYGSWVLIPRGGDWQEVQEKFNQFLHSS